MGSPDGGWYDEVPPRVIGATPAEHSVNVHDKKIVIRFSEFIKLDNATENVVICPPQLEQPEIKTQGKQIRIELQDSLKENTTYTIDFSDAISDNNEGNSMGNYTYVFSTGETIDTLEVSGYVLDAETLEPIKGSVVGLYNNLNDSAFTTLPMLRTGRTDASGHFVIRGIAPGSYRIYSLVDSDGDYKLSQRSEQLAFSHDIIVPTSKPDTRQDTTWVDSLHIASIARVPYTHFLPDDICLRAFTQKQTDQSFLKAERKDPDRFTLFFTAPADSLPTIHGLNFNADNAFVIEPTEQRDTITYWLRDTALVNRDTLHIELQYLKTDTLGMLVTQTDTLEILSKTPYAKRLKAKLEEQEKWEKEAEKARKKDNPVPPRPRDNVLTPQFSDATKLAPNQNIKVTFPQPLAKLDTAAIHLYSKIDTLWYNSPVQITSEGQPPRTYLIKGEWRPGTEYSLEVDSAAFVDIYGNVSDAIKNGVMVRKDEEFSSLFVRVFGVRNDTAQVIIRLLDKSEKLVAQTVADKGLAEFYYLNPGEYYISALIDYNRNGRWDTGEYSADLQPEEVYFNPDFVECKAKWDVSATIDISAHPLYEQKPREMVKQKGEQKKATQQNRNQKRAEELKIKYDRDKVNARF